MQKSTVGKLAIQFACTSEGKTGALVVTLLTLADQLGYMRHVLFVVNKEEIDGLVGFNCQGFVRGRHGVVLNVRCLSPLEAMTARGIEPLVPLGYGQSLGSIALATFRRVVLTNA